MKTVTESSVSWASGSQGEGGITRARPECVWGTPSHCTSVYIVQGIPSCRRTSGPKPPMTAFLKASRDQKTTTLHREGIYKDSNSFYCDVQGSISPNPPDIPSSSIKHPRISHRRLDSHTALSKFRLRGPLVKLHAFQQTWPQGLLWYCFL